MLSHVLANGSSSRIFSDINLNGFLSPLSQKILFKLQDKIVVSSMEKYPTAPSVSPPQVGIQTVTIHALRNQIIYLVLSRLSVC